EQKFNNGVTVSLETLVERNLIKENKGGVKVLAEGEFTKKLTFVVDKISESAAAKIKELGGEIK
ncbi:MAG: uL15 family ribosomal protein, partial [Deferribacterales bacterium]|nr:uL15 family ribosomal protein [Deferribacterales bacterium]